MALSAERQIDCLRQMWQIRCFEEQAIRLYGEGYYRGSTHPYIGQEATAVGVCAALHPSDPVLATYRGHGVAIARGSDPQRMMAEILGKATGLCKGKGGSMHLSDSAAGFLGSNAVVAAHIPMAGGVALAQMLRSSGAVTVCLFGEGASCEGIFYETCNMATLWKLPLILVVENNEFAIATPVHEAISVPNIADRAKGFGLPGITIDGRDVEAVYDTALAAVERARSGEGPTLIEAKTVRWTRHSAVSAGGSGSSKDAERWRTTDPIPRYTRLLLERHMLTEESADEIEKHARAEMQAAVEFAINSPYPSVAEVATDIFAE
jgi:TPP-dependent pyruvate/acetoin dehydrogenase alpha subunit